MEEFISIHAIKDVIIDKGGTKPGFWKRLFMDSRERREKYLETKNGPVLKPSFTIHYLGCKDEKRVYKDFFEDVQKDVGEINKAMEEHGSTLITIK